MAAFGLAALAFGHWTATSPWSFPRFLAALLVFVYLPGKALLDRARVSPSPLEDFTLSLVLGTIAGSGLYWTLRFLGLGTAFWLVPVAAAASTLFSRPSLRRALSAFGAAERVHAGLLGLLVLACAPLAAVPIYYRNFAWLPTGEMTYYPLADILMHVSFANALTQSVPPEVPFFPGHPLNYHYGMDLVAAMLADVAGIGVLDVVVRFVPTFFVVLVVLAGFCFARSWLGSAPAALWTTLLCLWGEDLSWLPGLLRGSDQPWVVHFFGMPSVVPLYDANPMLPALGILFAGLFCLLRWHAEGRRAWLALAAVFFAALTEYKVFSVAQVLFALIVTGAVYLVAFRDRRPLAAFLGTLALTLPLAVAAASVRSGASVTVTLISWPYVPAALVRSGLGDTWLARHAGELWRGLDVSPTSLAVFAVFALPLYLVAASGARVLGLPTMARALLRPTRDGATRFFLAVFVLAGPVLSLLFSVTPTGHPPEVHYNNAVWFFVQSKYLAWLFAVEALLAVGSRVSRPLRVVGLVLLLAVALPSSLEFFQRAAREQPNRLGPDELSLLDFLRKTTDRGAVVLARPDVAQAVIAMTPCRAPLLTIFPYSFVSPTEQEEYERHLAGFWSSWKEGRLAVETLRTYAIGYLAIDKERDGLGPMAAGFLAANPPSLDRLFENGRFVVFAVVGAGSVGP